MARPLSLFFPWGVWPLGPGAGGGGGGRFDLRAGTFGGLSGIRGPGWIVTWSWTMVGGFFMALQGWPRIGTTCGSHEISFLHKYPSTNLETSSRVGVPSRVVGLIAIYAGWRADLVGVSRMSMATRRTDDDLVAQNSDRSDRQRPGSGRGSRTALRGAAPSSPSCRRASSRGDEHRVRGASRGAWLLVELRAGTFGGICGPWRHLLPRRRAPCTSAAVGGLPASSAARR